MKKTMRMIAGMLTLVMLSTAAGCSGQETKTETSASAGTKAEEGTTTVAKDKNAFPNKQINLIIQAAPGGESDSTGRLIAQTMEQELGVPVVCSNKTGASGAVAFQYVRSQPADGYTIGICPAEIAMVNALGYSDVVPDDMDFLGGACETASAVIVSAKAPYDTLEEFVQYCKDYPGEVVSGTAGAGSTLHIGSEVFAREAGIQFSYVPFDGSGPAITALMGGHVDVVVIGVLSAVAGVESGDLKVLAILGDERSPVLPDVPTAKEAGVEAEYSTWVGLYGPQGLPDDVKATLEAAVKAGVEGKPYVEFTDSKGLTRKYRSAEEFTEFVNENFEMYSQLIPSLELQ
ncbi:tripartite tricarboxylate transporter substrate-binding protein [Lachnospiraceae bacterium 62-35]